MASMGNWSDLHILILFLCNLQHILANPSPNQFLFPTAEQSFHYLDTIEVQYQSNFSAPSISVWCKIDETSAPWVKSTTNVDGFNASALVPLQFTKATICWFELRQDELGINSPTFGYIAEKDKQATVLASDASVTAATSADTPSSTTNTALKATTSAPSEEDSQRPSSGLSTAAQAGIGIGAGMVGIGLGVIAAILFFIRRRKRGSEDNEKLQSDDSSGRAPSRTTSPPANQYYSPPEYGIHGTYDSNAARGSPTIYPDDSAFTAPSRPRSIHSTDRDYRTDFAMADRQIWTDHTRSNSPEGPAVPPPAMTATSGPYELDSNLGEGNQKVLSNTRQSEQKVLLPEGRPLSFHPHARPP
ncbi:hypothetical protein F5B20DRAFT_559725 [Whalleya microplaca]|nr:hypothetical protein F5B20DRAFT_559725 [Whalleya microplaca]